jgi:acid stress-induced BolA-like protein IbaG/YrbA
MHPDDVKQLLESRLPAGAQVMVQGDGRYFDVVVVSDAFDGLTRVRKQQLVLGALQAEIADGRLHAVNVKTLTPAEWQAAQD